MENESLNGKFWCGRTNGGGDPLSGDWRDWRAFWSDGFGVVSRGRIAAVGLMTDLLPLRRSGSSLASSEGY
jgi:hypothetical protein